jgi:acetylornithine deacetylase
MINEKVRADVIAVVDDLKEELIKLTSDIIGIPSITPTYPGEIYDDIVGGETKVNEFLRPLL